MNLFAPAGKVKHRGDFWPVGYSPPRWSTKKRLPRTKRCFLLSPFVWLSNKGFKRSFDSPTSPETTALISFEEFSSQSGSSSYEDVASNNLINETFPYWRDVKKEVQERAVQTQAWDLDDKLLVRKKQRSLRRSLNWLLSASKRNRKAGSDRSPSLTEEDMEDDDLDSQHFSISTDVRQSAFNPVKGNSRPISRILPLREMSSISLEQFMEDSTREKTAFISSPVNLAEISANDSASVGSAWLGVSYDEHYPQLVLQPSYDGTSSKMTHGTSTVTSNGTLGASFSHPSARTVGSSTEYSSSPQKDTPFDDNIDKVWHRNEGPDNDSSDDEDVKDWIDDAVKWSISAEDSVKRFTEMFEKDIVEPILKPIVRMVEEATDFPPPKNHQEAPRKSRYRIVKKL